LLPRSNSDSQSGEAAAHYSVRPRFTPPRRADKYSRRNEKSPTLHGRKSRRE